MKNNIFCYSPGGYGPHSRIQFWAEHIKCEEDSFQEAANQYIYDQEVDYGCYYMSRAEAESLFNTLKKLLEE